MENRNMVRKSIAKIIREESEISDEDAFEILLS